MADTAAAATAASSAPAASFLPGEVASVALSPSGQPRTLNESLREVLHAPLGTARTALGRALDPMGGLGIMFDVTCRPTGAD